jgi:glycosyl transferase family 87
LGDVFILDPWRRFDWRTWPGFVAWAAMFLIVVGNTLAGSTPSITPAYRIASESFMRGDSLYPDVSGPIAGFLYLPGFAVAFMPFDWLGPWIGDAVWKATGLALLTYAAWSSCREMHRDIRVRVLSVAFALSIPLLAGSFLNGQSNIHLAAACWLMTLSAFREKTTGVLFWTGAAILAKPLAIVMILLIAALRPRMIPALAGGIVWAIGLPLIAADGQYVLSLYRDCWKMLTTMAVSERFTTADFTAVILRLGWSLDLGLIAIIRCIAALAAWAIALWISFRLPRNAAVLGVMIIGASYMCLFNPRAEGLTYSILALPCAMVIGVYLYEGRARVLWAMAAVTMVVVGSNGISIGILNLTRYWFKPAVFIGLLVLMAVAIAKTWASDPCSTHVFDARSAQPASS